MKTAYPDHLRLSIHQSTGEHKVSISLLPTDTGYTTPWHCSIAFRLDGTTTTGPRSDFDSNPELELVHEDGRPSYYREKTDLLTWDTEKSAGDGLNLSLKTYAASQERWHVGKMTY